MPTGTLNGAVRHLLADLGPGGDGATDGELLARFVRSRDEDALAALVRRHAPMVWGVCRRLLRNHHDAEDAFQATFLVLVRKAAGVPRQAVANWLYGVARQTAVRVRATTAKRARRETQVANTPEPPVEEVRDSDSRAVLDEELGRLPGHYRGVVVLCDLESLTRSEAARHLGIPEGSVASRLARARAMLARRLARRGLLFSAPIAAVASASAPPALVASTIKAATLAAAGRAAGLSAKVAAITEGTVKAMFVTRLKSVLAVVLVAALACAAGLIYRAQGADQPQPRQEQPVAGKNRNTGGGSQARENPVAPPKQPARTDQERLVGGWVIVNDDSGRKGEVWEISADEITMHANLLGFRVSRHFHRLDPDKTPEQIDIRVTKTNLEPVGLIKGIYSLADDGELRLCLGGVGKDRPAAFPEKPKSGEVLVLRGPPRAKADGGALASKEERLKALIDKVLAAHGGEEKLAKLLFTMTVKHSNGETQHYSVQPPKDFRWETTHPDRTGRRIVILFPEGRRWWSKEPDGEAKEFRLTGIEPPVEYWHDNVKFFGPRQVLRLKDADHKVALLDEEAQIGDRPAVGVEVTGPHFKGKMYFDGETHLLVKRTADRYYRSQGFILYGDYKKFDGIPIARKEQDGYFEPEVTDFKVVEKFDSGSFERP